MRQRKKSKSEKKYRLGRPPQKTEENPFHQPENSYFVWVVVLGQQLLMLEVAAGRHLE